MNKNASLEFYRFLFMLVIVVFHFNAQYIGLENAHHTGGGI